jgi:rhodanese-related sulfurtransferase
VTISEISVHDLAAIGPAARIIDVREPNEWESGHIAHAVLVPLSTVPERLGAFDGSPTYVVCRSGARSANACRYLAEQGIDAVNVAGGMLAWVDGGFDTVSGAASGAADG